jgi:hypothetical protein
VLPGQLDERLLDYVIGRRALLPRIKLQRPAQAVQQVGQLS